MDDSQPTGEPPGERLGARATLSIGQLSRATGVPVATLRAWESRHGFPVPQRLASGHRRYSRGDVTAVQDVCRRRDAGMRLDVAIAHARTGPVSRAEASVFAHIAARHPAQPRQRLRKRTLTSISHAIEDEMAATAQRGHLFGGFQTGPQYAASRSRWADLARLTASAHVFADFDDLDEGMTHQHGAHRPVLVGLGPTAPMAREWVVVCDAPGLSATLIASEAPGQSGTPEEERVFETMWTVDAGAVRDAARTCAQVAAAAGSHRAADLLSGDLAAPAYADHDRRLVVERLMHRIVRYGEG
ncbi:DICT sensory domain-containing protein [Nocardioides halotolerans]|uniref:DICT sensory domain-containing protein n=1 Tax=Nocardioides halotolerans TaxID=433660 RepID=UPI00041BAE55|nr:DICT sensory domain-containing protein [Nocardioides halotolerans]